MGKTPKTKTIRVKYTFWKNRPNEKNIQQKVVEWTSKGYRLIERKEKGRGLLLWFAGVRGWTDLTFSEER